MIQYLKFVSEEDVLSEVVDQPNGFKLIKPARIVITPQGIGLAPLLPFAKGEEFSFREEVAIYRGLADDELVTAYRQFSSNLVMPSTTSILTPR